MKRILFPFSALVNQEEMKTALLLVAVDPSIGGVLISGHKGAGKSTAVRALAGILPAIRVVKGCPYNSDPDSPQSMDEFCLKKYNEKKKLPVQIRPMRIVELPLNATEDRIAGTLHIEEAIRKGKRQFEPGILAAANRGVLYVDEVNLLEDHLVDILLDAAASGINTVEREGVSITHPARFILIGTMNPEEGSLRPQFLDRFGLFVSIRGVEKRDQRREIVLRRMAFEQDSVKFAEAWEQEEKRLSELILESRRNLSQISIPDEFIDMAIELSETVEARGNRAEIVIPKAARALAALHQKDVVGEVDIRNAARFVLPHRMSFSVFHDPEESFHKLDEIIGAFQDKKKRL
ncbi:ATP-binding protein [Candidatus Sumerlaeota bacterium]|nr:ATP-binding protein [Candidatus Sumerlaeota bacterium]